MQPKLSIITENLNNAAGLQRTINVLAQTFTDYEYIILNGDNIRSGINRNLKFTEPDRVENIRRIAEISKLFLNCGSIVVNRFISPTKESRDMAKSIIGKENLIEVYVSTPIEVCEQRDTKGLYAKARSGELKNFTGISSPFEIPENPDIIVNTDELTLEQSTQRILDFLLKEIAFD